MANLPPLVAELIAKTDGFQAGLTRAAESARKSSGDISGAFEKIQSALGALGVGLSAAALAATVKHTTELGDELYKMSQRVGVSVENLSTLRYSFDLAGVSMEDMDGLLVKLNKKLGEAGAGSAEAGKFLKQFGIDVAEVKNGTLSTDEALKRISDRFASTPDGINKTTAATELFGKAGAKIIPFLNQGRDAIEGMQLEATKLGLKLSTEAAASAEKFNDAMRTLQFQSEGARNELVNQFIPRMTEVATAMKDAAIEGGKFAAILAGLQTYLTGSDRTKNDKELFELTEKKLELEVKIARIKGNTPSRIFLEKDLENVEAQIKTTLAYRKSLEETAAAEEEAARRREALKKNGQQLETTQGPPKAVKDRTAEFEREARAIVEGEERAVQDINEAWQAWEKQQVKDAEETSKAVAEQWKQVFAEIDADQERAIEDGRKYMESLKDDTKEVANFARDMGLTFSSAFEDAVVGGKKLSEVLDGLAKDLARIVVRKTATEPLGNAISDWIKGSPGAQQLAGPSDGGGGFFEFLKGLLPKFAGGTDYVPHDMAAIIHKGERIVPAAQNNGGGGASISLVFAPQIDSRTDQATIMLIMRQQSAALMEELARRFNSNGASAVAAAMR